MKKGDNSKKPQKFKKVKDTILRYLHIGIMLKFQTHMFNNKVCRSMTDKQTHTQTKNIHTE